MANVSILGLGAMGSRMALHLTGGEHALTIWSRSRGSAQDALIASGAARRASTIRDAAARADVVVSMVRDDEAARSIWLVPEVGALDAMRPGAIAIESSTLTPRCVRDLAAAASSRGVRFLEAPVVGSRPQAEAASLIYLVGGDRAVLDDVAPVLRRMGSVIHHVGPVGHAAVLKLAVNAMLAVQVAALAETLSLVETAGLDLARAVDVLGALPVCSPAAKAAASSMVAHAFAPSFPVALATKDLGYALDVAAELSLQPPLLRATRDVLATAIARGHAADHLTSLIALYRDPSGRDLVASVPDHASPPSIDAKGSPT